MRAILRQRTHLSEDASGRRSVLFDQERKIVTACAEVLLPAGGAIPLSGIDAGVVDYFDDVMARIPPTTRFLLRALLQFVERSPLLYGPFRKPVTKLGLAERRKVLFGLMNSRLYLLRTAFLGLRTVLTIAYFGNEEVNRTVGATPNLNPFAINEVAA